MWHLGSIFNCVAYTITVFSVGYSPRRFATPSHSHLVHISHTPERTHDTEVSARK